MAVVASWDGATRRIYLAQGVSTFHPVDDIYREYREERRTVEAFRQWEPFMVAVGNDPKGGGKYTPRYLLLLDDGDIGQVKIVPYDEAATIDVTGEVLTDDQTDPFDYSGQTTPTVVRYAPPEAEIIERAGTGLTEQESTDLSRMRKWVTNAQRIAEGTAGNFEVWDDGADPDVDTPLETQDVTDKDGNAIALPTGTPARRSEAT